MAKNSRRSGPQRPAAWRRRQALTAFIADEFGLTRLQAADRIREVEASDEPTPLGYTPCDRCPAVIVESFDPDDEADMARARRAVRLHALFCPGRAA
ncbi:hypothetical protein ADL35_12405 [Streptomyces sp. NRRL WC-3753]|nr:hypothetical protein ADL35_12405 [Streptomyces sp. NRRL WC-3753]